MKQQKNTNSGENYNHNTDSRIVILVIILVALALLVISISAILLFKMIGNNNHTSSAVQSQTDLLSSASGNEHSGLQSSSSEIKPELIMVYKYDYEKTPAQNSINRDFTVSGKEYNVKVEWSSNTVCKYYLNDVLIDNFKDTDDIAADDIVMDDSTMYDYRYPDAIYLSDINPDDNSMEIFVVKKYWDPPILYGYSYNGKNIQNLKCLRYQERYNNASSTTYDYSQSHPDSTDTDNNIGSFLPEKKYQITVNDDNTLSISTRTTVMGMWNVKRTFSLNQASELVEKQSDQFEIDIDEFVSFKDNNVFKNGKYAECQQDYEGLKKGEYFTLVADNGVDKILVETLDGRRMWIKNPIYNFDNAYEICPQFFWVAG